MIGSIIVLIVCIPLVILLLALLRIMDRDLR